MFQYIKYTLFHFWVIMNIGFLLMGGVWPIVGFLAAMNFIIFADTVFGDDKSEPEYKNPRILMHLIWALLPMSFLMLMTVDPKHSWNSNKKFGSWMTFNLNRHSHHHEDGSVPYYKLQSYDEAPMMYHGYITCMTIALLMPPVWNKIMAKKLIEWDEKYASEKEKKLAREANLKSGIKELVEYARGNEKQSKEGIEYV